VIKKNKLKMGFFGNSITCGHRIDVPIAKPDSGKAQYFNNYLTYSAIISRCFNAQYHFTSKSGIGLIVKIAEQQAMADNLIRFIKKKKLNKLRSIN
jgi:hypothetical protein